MNNLLDSTVEYKIVTEYAPDSLARKVNEHLKQGWKLYGPMVAIHTDRNPSQRFYQPLVMPLTANENDSK